MQKRIADMAKRCGDLSPIKKDVQELLYAGNARNKIQGKDPQGNPYARLAPSTLKRKPRPGNTPFVTRASRSKIIYDCFIDVRAGKGQLTFTQSWPNTFWIEYHINSTKNRPARDPYGFRQQDLDKIMDMLQDYVATGRWTRVISGIFGRRG